MSRFRHIDQAEPAREVDAPPRPAEPAYDYAWFVTRGDEALSRGRFEAALRLYGRALEEDRTRAAPWLGQIRALLEMGRASDALTWLEQAANVAGESPALHALWGIAAAREGRLEDAVAWSDRAMRHGRDEALVWLARAEVVYARGDVKIAGLTLNKAHEREPGPDTARRCGEVALAARDLPTARTWLERAVRALPEDPLVAMRLGVYWAHAGYDDRARSELERALALEPGLEPARLALDDLDARGPLGAVRAALRRLKNGR